MTIYQQKHGGLADFVNAGFPEPHNPIWQTPMQPNWDQTPQIAIGDFVDANFPEPHNPIWQSGMGSIGCGGTCGGTCSECGMGAVSVPSWAMSLPAPLNGMLGPLPTVYWGGIALAAIFVLPMVLGKKGRR